MRILLDPGTLDGLNAGDVAMLQGAVLRFRRLRPDARIDVITLSPEDLPSYCPGTEAVPEAGRLAWIGEQALFGRLRTAGPKPVGNALAAVTRNLRLGRPNALRGLLRAKAFLRGASSGPLDGFLEALQGADLYVVGGQASLNDTFAGRAGTILSTLEAAMAFGKRTALVGQAIGPLEDPRLLARARAVLPRADVIALREQRMGRPLLEELGVDPRRIETTGDDALELCGLSPDGGSGAGIGVNVRVAAYAGTNDALLGPLREVFVSSAARLGASLLPVPIAIHQGARDVAVLRALLADVSPEQDGGAGLRTPDAILAQVRRCRILVTGAYHAAVFALGQGIPAVCLNASAYYRAKWDGLADLFEGGCHVVDLEGDALRPRLEQAIDAAWAGAGALREGLLAAAGRQVAAGRRAAARAAGIPPETVAA